MAETRIGRKTPTQSVVLPYFATNGQEAIDLYLNDAPKMVHRSTEWF